MSPRGAGLPPELERVVELAAEMDAAGRPAPVDDAPEVVVTPMAAIRPEPVRWLWDGRIALGALGLLVGVPGLGKSMLALRIAARISRGLLPGDLYGQPRHVLYASAEDSPAHTLVPRLYAAGADPARVHIVTLRRDGIEGSITLPDDVDALARAVRDLDAALLIVDPIMAHLSDGLDSHRDHSIRRALAPLHHMATETGCAVLAVGHLNKAPSGDLFARVGGSIGLTGAARNVLLLTADPEREEDPDARLLTHGKSNLGRLAPALRLRVRGTVAETDSGPIPTAVIELGEEAPHLRVSDVLAPADRGQERTERDEAQDYLREALRAGPRPAREVQREARQIGVSDRTLLRALRELGGRPRREGGIGSAGRWVYELPDSAISPRPDGEIAAGEIAEPGGLVETQRLTAPPGAGNGLSRHTLETGEIEADLWYPDPEDDV